MSQTESPLYRASEPTPDYRPSRDNTSIRARTFEASLRDVEHAASQLDQPEQPRLTVSTVERRINHYENLTRDARSFKASVRLDWEELAEEAKEYASRYGITYKGRLGIAESLNPNERPQSLCRFVERHNKIMNCLRVYQALADLVARNEDFDTLGNAELQVKSLRWRIIVTRLLELPEESRIRDKLRDDIVLQEQANTVVEWMKREILYNLIVLDPLLPHPDEDVAYDNIGSDHDIAITGRVLPPFQPSSLHTQPQLPQRGLIPANSDITNNDADDNDLAPCAICLQPYTMDDPPLQLTECGHIVGRECMSIWLNSTHELAATCPLCRAVLCTRRPRRPRTPSAGQRNETLSLQGRVTKAANMMRDAIQFLEEGWGPERGQELRTSACTWLNEELEDSGTLFHVEEDAESPFGWYLYREPVLVYGVENAMTFGFGNTRPLSLDDGRR